MNDNKQAEYTRTLIVTQNDELSGDYILPDSFPDVKSVLSAGARISSLKKYFGPNDTQISGSIVYNIVFSASGEGEKDIICSVSFNDEFKENYKYRFETNSGAGAQTIVSQVTCRMANPRKFSIKSGLQTTIFEDVVCQTFPKTPADMPADADMQYRRESRDILGCTSVTLSEHSFSDNIEIDMKLPEIDKIVHWDAELNIRDERGTDAKNPAFKLGGILTLNLIYSDKNGEYYNVNKDIPFNISLNDDELAMLGDSSEVISVMPAVYLSAVNVNIGKNQYEEAKVIEFDADYDIDLMMFTTRNIDYVTDAYSTKYECECKYETETFLLNGGHINCNFTNSDTAGKNELGLSNSDIIMAFSAHPELVHVDKNGNYTALAGKLSAKSVINNADSIKGKDIATDFSYRAAVPENSTVFGKAFALGSRLRSDSDKVYSDAEVYLDYIACVPSSRKVCISAAPTGVSTALNKPVFSIYYPSGEDTLWDTAKKKKTTVETIKALNPDADVFPEIPLIIE